jgi:hypothetical protein
VHYVYYDGVIVFRSDAGTKLPTAANGDVLAFEVDAHDAELGRGWSVMVLGRANVVTTECGSYVRLSCELVTGRVIENDMAGLPLGGNP